MIFFAKQLDFRAWLEKNHNNETELWVGFYKVAIGKPSMNWSQSVDEAICFGWIDGIRKSIDKESYCIRFTPRNPKSRWSTVNINKAETLIKLGLMQPKGLELFINRQLEKSEVYSYENKLLQLLPDFEKRFMAHQNAWEYFSKQSASYQRMIYHWILSAKKETTQRSRLNKVIVKSELSERLY